MNLNCDILVESDRFADVEVRDSDQAFQAGLSMYRTMVDGVICLELRVHELSRLSKHTLAILQPCFQFYPLKVIKLFIHKGYVPFIGVLDTNGLITIDQSALLVILF